MAINQPRPEQMASVGATTITAMTLVIMTLSADTKHDGNCDNDT